MSNHQAFFLEHEVVMCARVKDDFNVKTIYTVHRCDNLCVMCRGRVVSVRSVLPWDIQQLNRREIVIGFRGLVSLSG